VGLPLLEIGFGPSNPLLDFTDGLVKHAPTSFVRRHLALPLELSLGQPERLERAHGLGVANILELGLRSRPLELFHPFLNSRLRVD